MGKVISAILVTVLTAGALKSQVKFRNYPGAIPWTVCYADDKPGHLNIPAPESYLSALKSGQGLKSEFNMTVISAPDTLAEDVAEAVGQIWASLLPSSVPINVEVRFRNMGDPNILGSTRPYGAHQVIDNGHLPVRLYHTPLAEKLWNRNLNGNDFDIFVEMNSTFNWYYGLEGPVPDGQHDFMTILLHELAHGLGFFGGFTVQDDLGYQIYTVPTVFDHFIENLLGQQLIDTTLFPIGSTELLNQLQSATPIYFRSPVILQELGEVPRLYVPTEWNSGSSLYHLDDVYDIKDDGRDALMTYSASRGEIIHDPGPLATFMLYESGWIHTYIEHDSLLDRESTLDPFSVTAGIYGDTIIEANSQALVYSLSGQDFDTVDMTITGNPDEYIADIPGIGTDTEVRYYIRTEDVFGREYTLPTQAPDNTYRFYVGTDLILPVIEHIPIRYSLLSNDSVEVRASILDNLGIDAAIVEYSINDVDQPSFELFADTLTEYAGHFIFTPGQLSAGDVIEYRIKAVDGAAAENTAYHPATGYHAFTVEDVSPVNDYYMNDFELETDMYDFLVSGTFKRDKPDGFTSWALHTDHPYPSPEKEDTYYDFYAQLKVPIRIGSEEEAQMTFDEIAFIEPGAAGTTWGDEDYFDFVILEFSKDLGSTWDELSDGYDCRAQYEWSLAWVTATWIGNTNQAVPAESNTKTRTIDLTTTENQLKEGDEILIRFRLSADPFAHGWGWMIDNLRIQPSAVTVEGFSMIPEMVSVYPNPTQGQLTLDMVMKEDVETLQIIVTDLLGRKVHTEELAWPGSEFRHAIDLGTQPDGVYLLQIISGGQKIVRKVLLAR